MDTLRHTHASSMQCESDFTHILPPCRLAETAVNLTDIPDMAENRGSTSNNSVRLPNQVRLRNISKLKSQKITTKCVYDYGCRSVSWWDPTVLERAEIPVRCQHLLKKRRKVSATAVETCVRMSSLLVARTLFQMIRPLTAKTAKILSIKNL